MNFWGCVVSSVSAVSAYSVPSQTGSIARTSSPGLVQSAVELASSGSMVSSLLGGAVVTYNAAGMLNSLAEAGNSAASPVASVSQNPVATAAASASQNVVSSLPSSSLYGPSGQLVGNASNNSANWAAALKANPALAPSMVVNAGNQAIVGSLLSVTA